MKIITVLVLALFVLPANAKVFKCMVNGQTKYQQAPCPEDSSSGGVIEVKPNTVSTAGLRLNIERDRIRMLREQEERDRMAAHQAYINEEMSRANASLHASEKSRLMEQEWQTTQGNMNKKIRNMKNQANLMEIQKRQLQNELQQMKNNAMFDR